ncbi:hypothetical protein LCGC14_2464800 [marine sediment metagenome]|uniref:Uncharacterized protein n=1 Tax=marine sediment metagenome TaxID=412755 RepID=A0A0F9DPC7_9ZZZZ
MGQLRLPIVGCDSLDKSECAGDVVEVTALSTVTWEFWGFYFLCEACLKKERKKELQVSVVESEEDRKQILRANPMYRDRS